MSLSNYYPKNFKANGWGWHRPGAAAAAIRGFLNKERGGNEGEGSSEALIGNGSLYPKLPPEDDTIFNTGGYKLYPALPAEEYESGAVEEVVEESCAAVNVNLVVSDDFKFNIIIYVDGKAMQSANIEAKQVCLLLITYLYVKTKSLVINAVHIL